MANEWVEKMTDHSYWNIINSWPALFDLGVRVVLLRASSGGTYKDTKFPPYYGGAKKAGMKVMAYHVNSPLFSATANMSNFRAATSGYELDGYPVIDAQLTSGMSYTTIRSRLYDLFILTKSLYGGAICYTAKWWWDAVMGTTGWARNYGLIVANYYSSLAGRVWPAPTAYAGTIPSDWVGKEPYAWQFSDKGLFLEVSPGNMDKNVLYKPFMDDLFQTVPTPPTNGVCIQMKTLQNMNVRSGPGIGYAIVGSTAAGTVVDVVGVGGSDCWIEIEPGRWIAVGTGGRTYCEKV